jgi:nitroreductase
MELYKVLDRRMSFRSFSEEPVADGDLEELVRCAMLAPSISNAQPWRFIAVTRPALLRQMAEVVSRKIEALWGKASEGPRRAVDHHSTFFAQAPAVIAVVELPYTSVADKLAKETNMSHEDLDRMRGYPAIQSIGAAVENMLLRATDLEYGSCWLSGMMVAREELEKLLGIESPQRLVTAVAVGRPGPDYPEPKPRKSIGEIFTLIE